MRKRGLTFKQAVNEAIRTGTVSPGRRRAFRTRTFDMGQPALPLDKALRLAGELEDEELIRMLVSFDADFGRFRGCAWNSPGA
jgi:hypothetical protein